MLTKTICTESWGSSLARKNKPESEAKVPEPPPPLILETTSEFDRGLKHMEKRGKRNGRSPHAVIRCR